MACLRALNRVPRALPVPSQCHLATCTAPAQAHSTDALGNRFCNQQHLAVFGRPLALATCTVRSQAPCTDALGNCFCNHEHLAEFGSTLAVPLAMQCHLATCTVRYQVRCKDLLGNHYCSDAHVPPEQRAARDAAIWRHFSFEPREAFLTEVQQQIITADFVGWPHLQEHFARDRRFNFFVLSMPLDTEHSAVLRLAEYELARSCFNEASAVLQRKAGGKYFVADLRANDLKIHAVVVSRRGNAGGRSGLEGMAQSSFAHVEYGLQLVSGVSGNGGVVGPNRAVILFVASLQLPADAVLKPQAKRYHDEMLRHAQYWERLPPRVQLAARMPALADELGDSLLCRNVSGLPVELFWKHFVAREASLLAAGGLAPALAPAPARVVWDGVLDGVAVRFTGCRADHELSQRLLVAGATVELGSKFNLLVYKSHAERNATYRAAVDSGVPVVSDLEFLERVCSLSGGGVDENDQPNSPMHRKRHRSFGAV